MTWQPVIPRWWSHAQRARLASLQAEGAWIGYWNTNEEGQPARYGVPLPVPAGVGVVHTSCGPLRLRCGEGQLHATRRPLKWPGSRVWVIALIGEHEEEDEDEDEKCWSLQREVIGEVFQQDDPDGEAGIRSAIRSYANLRGANLRGADLQWANLRWANLRWANLRGADLRGADLRGADLRGANLRGADLRGADLRGADLRGADLRGANLRWVGLRGADLRGADLRGTILEVT